MKKILIALALCFMLPSIARAQEPEIVELDNELDETLVPAPDFALKTPDGNIVNLADYQGSWVVLDFWGSWCRFCIQGIPEMKKAYEQYHPKGLEIIGIDCNEPEADWLMALGKYDLPWINVYNPGGRDSVVTQAYAIQGYPTKVIVDPMGYIYEVVLGEDPEFYDLLKEIFPE